MDGNHKGKMLRLSGPSGQIDSKENPGDGEDKIVRSAILVHAGAHGGKVTFMSGDGEISFDDARVQRIVNNQNTKIQTLAAEYGGLEKMPMGAFAPILDQHSQESNDGIRGRLSSILRFERRKVPGVGDDVACAVADITFLGSDTVKRVKDGRIYHLSIGINEDTDTLGEVSTVIEPAAPGAMLLSGKKGGMKTLAKGGSSMSAKLKRLKAHTDRMAKLTAITQELKTLGDKADSAKKLVAVTREKVLTGDKEGRVTARLQKLMGAFKMTPVEFKALNVKKLSAMSDESLDVVFAGYEARPELESEKQRGSTDAIETADLTKNLEKRQMKRLKSEIKGDFRKMGKKLAKDDDEDKEHGDTYEMGGGNKENPVNPGKDPHSVPGQEGDEKQLAALWGKHCADMSAALEKGDVDSAKKVNEAMTKHMASHGAKGLAGEAVGPGDVKSEDEKKSLETLQGQLDEVHTNMARLAGMVSELMSAEKEEGHELERKIEKDDAKSEVEEDLKPGEKAS